ncbi:MAG: bifunctional riboflavin kinase/FAD synthetase [Eubacteriales bacterium]
MKIIKDTKVFQIQEETAVAIGKFDGIHKGHQALLAELLRKKSMGLQTAIFTFDPPATTFFQKGDNICKDIATREEKRDLFREIGVDYLIEYPLDEETAHMEPQLFVWNVLCNQMNMKYLVAGADVSFGYKGKGNALLLQELESVYQYNMAIVDKVSYEEHIISSTYIRSKILDGNMNLVTKLLGRPYSFVGNIIPGKQLGRTIDMPTANLIPDECKLIPPCGVYYSKVLRNGMFYNAISNVGYKPTVTIEQKLLIETYLFDFAEDLYGEVLEVFLLEYKRPEYKFTSFVQLTETIQQDKQDATVYFAQI